MQTTAEHAKPQDTPRARMRVLTLSFTNGGSCDTRFHFWRARDRWLPSRGDEFVVACASPAARRRRIFRSSAFGGGVPGSRKVTRVLTNPLRSGSTPARRDRNKRRLHSNALTARSFCSASVKSDTTSCTARSWAGVIYGFPASGSTARALASSMHRRSCFSSSLRRQRAGTDEAIASLIAARLAALTSRAPPLFPVQLQGRTPCEVL